MSDPSLNPEIAVLYGLVDEERLRSHGPTTHVSAGIAMVPGSLTRPG